MKSPSIRFALCASLLAAFIVVVHAMPPLPRDRETSAPPALLAQAEGGRSFRREEIEDRDRSYRRELRRTIVDCHRDVRTHRIGGERVRHRHVGDNCEVRIVRQSTQPAPQD